MAVEKMLTSAAGPDGPPRGLSTMQSELRQMGDRLGLSPMAKARLKWVLSTDEVGEKRQEQAQTAAPAAAPPRRRLKVADGS